MNVNHLSTGHFPVRQLLVYWRWYPENPWKSPFFAGQYPITILLYSHFAGGYQLPTIRASPTPSGRWARRRSISGHPSCGSEMWRNLRLNRATILLWFLCDSQKNVHKTIEDAHLFFSKIYQSHIFFRNGRFWMGQNRKKNISEDEHPLAMLRWTAGYQGFCSYPYLEYIICILYMYII